MRQRGDGAFIGVNFFFRDHRAEPIIDFPIIQQAKGKMLAARLDGRGQFVRLRGRQHEERARGRFLQGLEQRVEGLRGQHVRFVNDEDLVAIARGQVAHRFPQFADFVDAAVGGGVNFLDVHGISRGDFHARRARAVGSHRGPRNAVERLGQDARRGGLSHAARPREDVSVGDAIRLDGVLQSVGYQVLTHHVIESLGAIFAGDDLVGHGKDRFRFWI